MSALRAILLCNMTEVILDQNQNSMAAPVADPEIEDMAKAGVHLGHAKSKNHPSMQEYLFGVRNGVSVIDLVKTKEKLATALEFLKMITSRGGVVLLVGTRPVARAAVLDTAEATRMPYFAERWIGGTLTNFKVISKRVEYFEKLEEERRSGGFEKFTKKEQSLKNEELVKLAKNFSGIRSMKRLPDAIFIVDINEDETAIREARITKIPVVALVDTNSNAKLVDYPIPSNDDALPAVRYMIGKIREALEEGFRLAALKKESENKSEVL